MQGPFVIIFELLIVLRVFIDEFLLEIDTKLFLSLRTDSEEIREESLVQLFLNFFFNALSPLFNIFCKFEAAFV